MRAFSAQTGNVSNGYALLAGILALGDGFGLLLPGTVTALFSGLFTDHQIRVDMGLNVAGVDMLRSAHGPVVVEVIRGSSRAPSA